MHGELAMKDPQDVIAAAKESIKDVYRLWLRQYPCMRACVCYRILKSGCGIPGELALATAGVDELKLMCKRSRVNASRRKRIGYSVELYEIATASTMAMTDLRVAGVVNRAVRPLALLADETLNGVRNEWIGTTHEERAEWLKEIDKLDGE